METKLLCCPEDNALVKKVVENMDYAQLLVYNCTDEMVTQACADAIYYGFNAVVSVPHNVERVIEKLKGSRVKTLLGFGDGGRSCIEARLLTAEKYLKIGIQELDMIINIPMMLDRKYDVVKKEISAMVDLTAGYGVGVKVILEAGFLTDAQKIDAAEMAIECGAQFLKLTTGAPGTGVANMHDILLLRKAVGNRIKIKASGQILWLEDAMAFMEAGVDRTAGRDTMVQQLKQINYIPA